MEKKKKRKQEIVDIGNLTTYYNTKPFRRNPRGKLEDDYVYIDYEGLARFSLPFARRVKKALGLSDETLPENIVASLKLRFAKRSKHVIFEFSEYTEQKNNSGYFTCYVAKSLDDLQVTILSAFSHHKLDILQIQGKYNIRPIKTARPEDRSLLYRFPISCCINLAEKYPLEKPSKQEKAKAA